MVGSSLTVEMLSSHAELRASSSAPALQSVVRPHDCAFMVFKRDRYGVLEKNDNGSKGLSEIPVWIDPGRDDEGSAASRHIAGTGGNATRSLVYHFFFFWPFFLGRSLTLSASSLIPQNPPLSNASFATWVIRLHLSPPNCTPPYHLEQTTTVFSQPVTSRSRARWFPLPLSPPSCCPVINFDFEWDVEDCGSEVR